MNSRVRRCAVLILAAGLLASVEGQRGGGAGRGIANPEDGVVLPPFGTTDIGRIKAEREQSLKDATRLSELAEKVKDDLSVSSSFTLSLGTLKNLDEMEKLTKKLRSRLKTGTPRPDPAPDAYDVTRHGPGR
jgi:hypothetical protein